MRKPDMPIYEDREEDPDPGRWIEVSDDCHQSTGCDDEETE
jgi:hypothetical protein